MKRHEALVINGCLWGSLLTLGCLSGWAGVGGWEGEGVVVSGRWIIFGWVEG